MYGDWLYERRDFREAALGLSVYAEHMSIYLRLILTVFRQAKKMQKAMLAHEKALEWQEVFELALQESLSAEELKEIGYRLAGKLCNRLLDFIS